MLSRVANSIYWLSRYMERAENVARFIDVKKASQLFDGVAEATMLHGEGWHFYRVGRLMERADKTSRLLDVKYYILLPSVADVGTPLDDIQWAAVLHSTSALEMYRKRHGHI